MSGPTLNAPNQKKQAFSWCAAYARVQQSQAWAAVTPHLKLSQHYLGEHY